jgi:hypothetical protein
VYQALGNAEPALDLGQHQHAGVRRQPAAVEGSTHQLARDRRREGVPIIPFHGALHGGSG